MKTQMTESDKKLLSYLAAFAIGAIFLLFVVWPLISKTTALHNDVSTARVEVEKLLNKQAATEAMLEQEETAKSRMENVLARFYPMLDAQDLEKMATTLMLNHGLDVQSVAVSMPESPSELPWYVRTKIQEEEADNTTGNGEDMLSLYGARVTLVADGTEGALWSLVDDISENYPAISIADAQWTVTETVTEGRTYTTQNEEGEEMTVTSNPVTVLGNRLTLTLEIFMCNQ